MEGDGGARLTGRTASRRLSFVPYCLTTLLSYFLESVGSGAGRRGAALYHWPYSMTAVAQERLVMEVRRSGVRVNVFHASQQASRMAS